MTTHHNLPSSPAASTTGITNSLRCVLSLTAAAFLFLPACSKKPEPKTSANQTREIPSATVTNSATKNVLPPRDPKQGTPQTAASAPNVQKQPIEHALAEALAQQVAMMRAQANQMAQLNIQRQRAEQQAQAARYQAMQMNAMRQQAEMRAQAAGRQGANRAQRNLNRDTGGYLGSLDL